LSHSFLPCLTHKLIIVHVIVLNPYSSLMPKQLESSLCFQGPFDVTSFWRCTYPSLLMWSPKMVTTWYLPFVSIPFSGTTNLTTHDSIWSTETHLSPGAFTVHSPYLSVLRLCPPCLSHGLPGLTCGTHWWWAVCQSLWHFSALCHCPYLCGW
jgi:hypothetical protein